MALKRTELPEAIGEMKKRFYKLTGVTLVFLQGINPGVYVAYLVGNAVHYILYAKDGKASQHLKLYMEIGNIVAQLPRPLPKQFTNDEIRQINSIN